MKPIFQKKLEIFDLEIVKTLPKLRFLAIFSTLHFLFAILSLVFLDFVHSRWVWCLVVFLQLAGPVSVFLFIFCCCLQLFTDFVLNSVLIKFFFCLLYLFVGLVVHSFLCLFCLLLLSQLLRNQALAWRVDILRPHYHPHKSRKRFLGWAIKSLPKVKLHGLILPVQSSK